ncbi:hypothetical protein F01_400100 [Burkholderia cenocepacia]|nr:hypothetical protein F01_400100 [Burkholderia cenocepacia]
MCLLNRVSAPRFAAPLDTRSRRSEAAEGRFSLREVPHPNRLVALSTDTTMRGPVPDPGTIRARFLG